MTKKPKNMTTIQERKQRPSLHFVPLPQHEPRSVRHMVYSSNGRSSPHLSPKFPDEREEQKTLVKPNTTIQFAPLPAPARRSIRRIASSSGRASPRLYRIDDFGFDFEYNNDNDEDYTSIIAHSSSSSSSNSHIPRPCIINHPHTNKSHTHNLRFAPLPTLQTDEPKAMRCMVVREGCRSPSLSPRKEGEGDLSLRDGAGDDNITTTTTTITRFPRIEDKGRK